MLAVPLVVISSRADLGLAARRRGWFLIPEEIAPPEELQWLDQDATWQRRARSGAPWRCCACDRLSRRTLNPPLTLFC